MAYRKEMLDALQAARGDGVAEKDIVTASVFTTQSATAVLEKIRDQIHAATPDPADFNVGADGRRTVFPRDDVTGITFHKQTSDHAGFHQRATHGEPDSRSPRAARWARWPSGSYLSPDYEVHPGEYIPPVGTRTGTPEVQGYNKISFNLFLPSGQMPVGGWPVAIYGHGNTDIRTTASWSPPHWRSEGSRPSPSTPSVTVSARWAR